MKKHSSKWIWHNIKKARRKRISSKKNIAKKMHRSLIEAPEDLRLLDNPEETLRFIRQIRKEEFYYPVSRKKKIDISLKKVKEIDYAAISIIKTISVNRKSEQKIMSFKNPEATEPRKMLKNTGFFKDMYNEFGKKIKGKSSGEMMTFSKGSGRLKSVDILEVSNRIKRVLSDIGLTGDNLRRTHSRIHSIVLEICGNAIEWGYSETKNRKWIMGIYRKSEKTAIVTITDIGKGIIETLNKKWKDKLPAFLGGQDSVAILNQAFEKKYGSNTGKINRNHGLPAIKKGLQDNLFSKLYVVTNDGFIDFENEKNSKKISSTSKFRGTFYQWSIENEN